MADILYICRTCIPGERMKIKYALLVAVLIAMLIFPSIGTLEKSETGENGYQHSNSCHPLMRPDLETRHKLLNNYDSASYLYAYPEVTSPGASRSLLNHLSYMPAERDQGSCGNCWVWAGTGVLEVALSVNEGILIAFLFNISTQNTMAEQGLIGQVAEARYQILQTFTPMRNLPYLGPTQTLPLLIATKRMQKEPAFLGNL